MFWAFEKGLFHFFANFKVTKLKSFSGKVRQSVENYLNENMDIGSFLENGFEATLSSETNVLSVWKGHFSVFCKFLSDEVETIFWESEAKRSKLFKSKFGQKKLFRKWLWSNLELKNECSEGLKRTFFSFLQIFECRSWSLFSDKVRQSVQNYLNKNLVIRNFLENYFEATLSSKTNVLSVWKWHFSVFSKFLSDEGETAFWESEAMLLCWELFRKCF